MGRHQTGCGWNRSLASLGGVTADTHGSRPRTGDRRSYFGVRKRSAGGEDSARPAFQRSNGAVTQSNEPPTNPGRFIPTEPDNSDAECELKAMGCIAKIAERDDIRDLCRIEVRQVLLGDAQAKSQIAGGLLRRADPHAPALHRVDVGPLSGRRCPKCTSSDPGS